MDEKGLSERNIPSLISQLKGINAGSHLTKMEKDEIKNSIENEECLAISADEWEEMFGESDVSDFSGFDLEEVDSVDVDFEVEDDDGIRTLKGDTKEVVVNLECSEEVRGKKKVGNEQDLDVRVLVHKLLTVIEDDGGFRLANEEERSVYLVMKNVYDSDVWVEVPGLKAQDRRKINKEVKMVESLMHNFVRKGMSVSDVNRLLYMGAYVVAERLGVKGRKKGKKMERKKPRWQRRIEKSIKNWRKDLSRIQEIRRGVLNDRKIINELNRKYQVTEKGTLSICTLLKRKIESGSTKIRWYIDNCAKVRQNNLFKNNQSQLYKELGGKANSSITIPQCRGSNKVLEWYLVR